jgi:hypothetical protein
MRIKITKNEKINLEKSFIVKIKTEWRKNKLQAVYTTPPLSTVLSFSFFLATECIKSRKTENPIEK